MARKKRSFPIPKLSKRGKSFRIRWFANGTLYEFSLGDIEKGKAIALITALTAAFAERADIPDEIATSPPSNDTTPIATMSTPTRQN